MYPELCPKSDEKNRKRNAIRQQSVSSFPIPNMLFSFSDNKLSNNQALTRLSQEIGRVWPRVLIMRAPIHCQNLTLNSLAVP